MRPNQTPTAAEQRYAQAHAAHYTDDDLLGALRGYGDIIASHPDSPEAGYSRTQILAIVNRVVPAEELLASHTALVLRRLQPEGERSAAPVAEAEDLGIDCGAEQFRRFVGSELEQRALATLLDPAARSPDPGREADFGAEFRPLLMRIRRALDVREDGGGPASSSTLSWRATSHPFEQEAEALIAKHRLEEPLATYVRHVVREGFDVDFDLMDPTPNR